jgi:hypothetical protein
VSGVSTGRSQGEGDLKRDTPLTPLLVIELVPASCWYSNVRSEVTSSEWEACKRYVGVRSGYRCEICGGRGQRWPIECHEVWEYDDERNVQRLVDLIALCPACHEVKHAGRAEAMGRLDHVLAHLAQVNNWSVPLAMQHFNQTMLTWSRRSQHEWLLDISFLVEVLGP